jgi:hypothetical protein
LVPFVVLICQGLGEIMLSQYLALPLYNQPPDIEDYAACLPLRHTISFSQYRYDMC